MASPLDVLVSASVALFVASQPIASHARQGSGSVLLTVADVDVAGVKLGMSPDEAVAAIKSFHPNFEVKKLYSESDNKSEFENPGQAMSEYQRIYSNPVPESICLYLTGISAETNPPTPGAEIGSYLDVAKGNYENITVILAPVLGHEKVIAVTRTMEFRDTPAPTTASIKQGLLEKYPEEAAGLESESNREFSADWFFDGKGRVMSKARATRMGQHPSNGRLPQAVNEGGSVSLSIDVGSASNNLVAGIVRIALYDQTGLYRSVEQSRATYMSLKARADASAVSKASNGAPATKF